MPETFKGTIFLLALVMSASLMPVEKLPLASWQTALGLGFVSAVFDNIPLTALALRQGGYDWGFLAYAVGFGGSMIWFGSSAGVALSNMYPGSQIGRPVAAARLARGRRLCDRLLRHAGAARLESRRPPPQARRRRRPQQRRWAIVAVIPSGERTRGRDLRPSPIVSPKQRVVAVSHLAELVRGNLSAQVNTPSSGLRPPSPQGEKDFRPASKRAVASQRLRSRVCSFPRAAGR